jgi:PAS domain S-box-containing protein
VEEKIMMEQLVADQPQTAPGLAPAHAAASLEISGEHGTLMIDHTGRILSCGAPAEKLFGASQARLIGRQISDFVTGLLLGGTSPSYRARYLVYLCADGGWRQFEAKDAHGGVFAVELSVSQMMANGREIFLLTVRRPAMATAVRR